MAQGRKVDNWQNALDIFLSEIAKNVEPYTVKKYRWGFSAFFRALDEAGLESNPARIGEREIRFLLDVTWRDLESSTRKWYANTFSMVLQRFGNNIIPEMKLRFPQDARTNVDWLTPQQMVSLLDFPFTPLELIVIHFELSLGLRNVEVKRLRVQDIKNGHIEVRGKGSDYGKWRTVSFHPDTQYVLDIWVAERNRMIVEAKQYKPNIEVPDNLIIWKRYVQKPQIGAYTEESNGLSKITISRIRERIDIDFANHTLRRTFGRSLWLSGKVKVETISKIYGHNDTATTLDYIGVNLDDMSDALGHLSDYQKDLKTNRKKT